MQKLLLIGTLVILSGCVTPRNLTPINNNGDGGFLSQEPCGPPCFYEITPGITSPSMVIELTQAYEDIFINCNFIDFTASGGKSGVSCNYIDMVYQDNVVKGLGYIPSVSITSQEVINEYGNPDRVSAYITSLPDSPFRVTMDFCYDSIQAQVGFSEQSGMIYTMNPDTLVYIIGYDSINSYNTICGEKPNKTQWRGFGEYVGFMP